MRSCETSQQTSSNGTGRVLTEEEIRPRLPAGFSPFSALDVRPVGGDLTGLGPHPQRVKKITMKDIVKMASQSRH